MVQTCAACGKLTQAELHTASGWVCLVCLRSASSIVVTYIINGQRFLKSLKEIPETKKPARSVAGVSPFQRKER